MVDFLDCMTDSVMDFLDSVTYFLDFIMDPVTDFLDTVMDFLDLVMNPSHVPDN